MNPTAVRPARAALGWLVDAVLPPRCVACAAPTEAQGRVCAACWSRLTFIVEPLCAVCGVPFPVPAPPGSVCGACLAEPPAYGVARAALVYGDGARAMVLGFKHGDRTHAAAILGGWMARAGAGLLAQADVVAPVPLHRWRLFARRYNQAALLARAVGRLAGLPVAYDALVRKRPTPGQGGLDRSARRANVQGAFAVRRADRVAGRRVVVIDDVMTTGATAEACARVLGRAGAASVAVLVLARAVRADSL
ncbi:MAG: ComF family protein [Alphaproteobacteria bacterium]